MSDLKFCRICLDSDVRMYRIVGSEVEYVYEKLTNKVHENGRLYYACYLCYWQLKKCQQLIIRSQKSEKLLQQILEFSDEQNLKSIALSDRIQHGLDYSLIIVTNVESPQRSECIEVVKTETQGQNDIHEVMVKYEPEDKGAPANIKPTIDVKHILKQDEVNAIESMKTENNSRTQTDTIAVENKSSEIIYDGKNNEMFDKNVNSHFICNECGKNFKTKILLIVHIRDEHVMIKSNKTYIEALKFMCSGLTKKDYLKKNFDNCKKPFKCQYCNYTAKYKSHLERHIRTHTGEKPFKCQYCQYTSSDPGTLKKHIRTHTGEKPFKCTYCNCKFAQTVNLKKHIRTHTRQKSFKCEYCSYTSAKYINLKRHIISHTGESIYKCEYCDYTSRQKGNLRRHVRTHTGEKPFQCHYCNCLFSENFMLKKHIRIHSGEKPFKCQYCDYTCAQNNDLKLHIRSHKNDKPFKCPHCNVLSSNKYHLKRHIRSHTGEKPFKCKYCNYTCSQNSNLKRHIRTHTGEKPYKCQQCNYTSAESGHLKRHFRSHTGEKPYICEICGKEFRIMSNLKNHFRVHNGKTC